MNTENFFMDFAIAMATPFVLIFATTLVGTIIQVILFQPVTNAPKSGAKN